jgi:hypothetical protein
LPGRPWAQRSCCVDFGSPYLFSVLHYYAKVDGITE